MANVRMIRCRLLAAFGAAVLSGCGAGGPQLRPVSGTVSLPGGDPAVLAGSAVEVALDTDPTVRASGTIGPDGRFRLETLRDGAVRTGAPEGTYKARIILGDDDPAVRKKATKAVPARFQAFESSGLTFRVPADGDVTLAVATR